MDYFDSIMRHGSCAIYFAEINLFYPFIPLVWLGIKHLHLSATYGRHNKLLVWAIKETLHAHLALQTLQICQHLIFVCEVSLTAGRKAS